MINIGTTSSCRLTVKLLKGDTEADAQRRVDAKILEKLGAFAIFSSFSHVEPALSSLC
jgi:hypothetical protein